MKQKVNNIGQKLSKTEQRKVTGGSSCLTYCSDARSNALAYCHTPACVDDVQAQWHYCIDNCGEQQY